jgi:hypothetical protein
MKSPMRAMMRTMNYVVPPPCLAVHDTLPVSDRRRTMVYAQDALDAPDYATNNSADNCPNRTSTSIALRGAVLYATRNALRVTGERREGADGDNGSG